MADKETIYYHGSNALFKAFSLDYAGVGTGVKFGYGIYLTSRYETAAHYARPRKAAQATIYYVYTVAIPSITEANCLSLNPSVHVSQHLVDMASERLGEDVPSEASVNAKFLRKYIGNLLLWKSGNATANAKRPTVRQMIGKADFAAEKAASEFLNSIGIEYYEWPVDWKHPDGETNIAVLNSDRIRIIKIEKIELDTKHFQLIEGSQRAVSIL